MIVSVHRNRAAPCSRSEFADKPKVHASKLARLRAEADCLKDPEPGNGIDSGPPGRCCPAATPRRTCEARGVFGTARCHWHVLL